MRLTLLVLSVLLFLSFGSADADCIDYGDYLHWESAVPLPPWSLDVDVSGTYAYATIMPQSGQGGLRVIDISDVSKPRLVGGIDCGTSKALSIAGRSACVLGDRGLRIVDLSDPLNLTLRGGLGLQGGVSVTAAGNYAYVGTQGGLLVVDITDPDDPRQLGEVWTESVYGVASSGTFVYIASSTLGLTVVDVADPEDPRVVARLSLPGYARDVAVSGSYAYVAGAGFFAVDVSEPDSPSLIGSVADVAYTHRLALYGNLALLSTAEGTIESIDVSDPWHPRRIGRTQFDGSGEGIATAGDHACVVSQWALHLVAIRNGEGAHEVSYLEMPWPLRLAVQGTHAYAAVFYHGLEVIDIQDPESPYVVGTLEPPCIITSVAVADDFAYLGGTNSGAVLVVDVQDPANPAVVGSVSTGGVWDVALSGGYAYATASEAGLVVIDIADPQNPIVVGSVPTPDWPITVDVAGSAAYILDYSGGFVIADVSDPTSPRIVGHLSVSDIGLSELGIFNDLAVSGTFVYFGASGKLWVIDVSDPENPRIAGRLALVAGARGIAISGTSAYVAGQSGLQVIDVSDPANPRVLGDMYIPSVGDGTSMAVGGGYAYMGTANPHGLYVCDMQCDEASDVAAYHGSSGRLRIFPSPASDRATIRLAHPSPGSPVAAISDISGRCVRRLHGGSQTAGRQEVRWDGRDDAGRAVAAGVYLVRISTTDGTTTGRVVLIR